MSAVFAILVLASTLNVPGPGTPPAVEAALEHALALPRARVQLLDYRPQSPICPPAQAEATRPITASGQVALRLSGSKEGRPCESWAWATVRVFTPSWVTTRSLREGEPLDGALRAEMREVREGLAPLTNPSSGAVTVRALPAGQVVLEADSRTGPRPGDPLTVAIRIGALEVEEIGRALPCARGRVCALLPSGKRLEGDFRNGRLMVEAP
jgi:hypothetical protein